MKVPENNDDIIQSVKAWVEHKLYVSEKRRKAKKIREKAKKQAKKQIRESTIATLCLDKPKRCSKKDWILRNLVKNGRDYSGGSGTFKTANSIKSGMTKSEKNRFDWEHRPHIVYTPMGGQNKKY